MDARPDPPSRMTSMAAWLQPRAGGDLPNDSSWGRHGVGVDFKCSEEGCVLIAHMESGGPASRSGVCLVGDELLKVDGKVVEKAPIRSINEAVAGRAGTALSLTLRRARHGMSPMLYEVELVRGDAEFMDMQARNKVLSRENSTLVTQVDQLKRELQEKDAKLNDMVRDLNEFDKIASRAQEARRYAEQHCARAESEVMSLKSSQKNIDDHVSRLVAELRAKEAKLQQFTGKGRSRSASPIPGTDTAATTVMGDASVQLQGSGQYGHDTRQLQADLRNALSVRDQLQEQLTQQQHMLIKPLEHKCQLLEAQLAEQTSDALSAKRSLSLQIDSAKEQLSTDKQQIKNLLDDNASLAAQLSATQQELASSMQAQYLGSQQADNELKKATLALNEAEAQLEEAQDKLKKFSVRNELLADAAAEHQKLQNQHTEVLDELSEARRLLQVHDADKQAGILALESKHEAIENALQGTIQQLHDAGKVREENLAAERAAQVSAVEAELQKARSQIRELEQDLSLASQTVAR